MPSQLPRSQHIDWRKERYKYAHHNTSPRFRPWTQSFQFFLLIWATTTTWSIGGIRVYTSLQIRKSPGQNWSVNPQTISSNRIPAPSNASIHRMELFDEPHRTRKPHPWVLNSLGHGNTLSYRDSSSRPPKHSSVNEQHRIGLHDGAIDPPHRRHAISRYRRTGHSEQSNVALHLPWRYRPKCRSCGRPLLQDSFCSDDFVLRAYIYEDVTQKFGDRQFLVYVYEIYKDTRTQFRAMHYFRITYRCDRFHQEPLLGHVYLITGLYVEGVPKIDSCSWKSKWSAVTKQQKRYLRTKYHMYCGVCQMQRVFRIDHRIHRRPDTCYIALSPNFNEMACRDRFSICRYRRLENRCEFNYRAQYEVCAKWLSHKI